MALLKSRNILRISPTDWQDNYICNKISAGENVDVTLENGPYGEQLVITANRTQARKVRVLNTSGVVNFDEYLVLVDASVNPIVVTLPPAHDYVGQLHIVCVDASNGVEIIPNASTSNVIFDVSNIQFHSKGDSLTFVSDRGSSPPLVNPNDPSDEQLERQLEIQSVDLSLVPGTWYVVGRYTAAWYA